jgi:XTP/dITP diphosphohydrolase
MPPETGDSYRENAVSKARFVAQKTGQLTLADDSGLEVDALKGNPGSRSARFACQNASDAEKVEKLLCQMRDVRPEKRTAKFVCAIALADPRGHAVITDGFCRGRIAFGPAGSNGFGYDPIFELADGRTLAELSDREKDRISHRGQALNALLPELRTRFAEWEEKEAAE